MSRCYAWIADMDFETPPAIKEAICKRLEHPVLAAVLHLQSTTRRFQWWFAKGTVSTPRRGELMYTPGVVAGLYKLVQLFTEKGTASL